MYLDSLKLNKIKFPPKKTIPLLLQTDLPHYVSLTFPGNPRNPILDPPPPSTPGSLHLATACQDLLFQPKKTPMFPPLKLIKVSGLFGAGIPIHHSWFTRDDQHLQGRNMCISYLVTTHHKRTPLLLTWCLTNSFRNVKYQQPNHVDVHLPQENIYCQKAVLALRIRTPLNFYMSIPNTVNGKDESFQKEQISKKVMDFPLMFVCVLVCLLVCLLVCFIVFVWLIFQCVIYQGSNFRCNPFKTFMY